MLELSIHQIALKSCWQYGTAEPDTRVAASTQWLRERPKSWVGTAAWYGAHQLRHRVAAILARGSAGLERAPSAYRPVGFISHKGPTATSGQVEIDFRERYGPCDSSVDRRPSKRRNEGYSIFRNLQASVTKNVLFCKNELFLTFLNMWKLRRGCVILKSV